MNSPRRLGRGLEALLGRSLEEPARTHAPVPQAADATSGAAPDEGVMTRDAEGQRWLDVAVIEPNPYQPRKHFDEEEIADLTDSIRAHGLLQPLVVRRVDGRFELVAGERRLRAAQAAGWPRVPVVVRDVDDRETAELAIVENLQRTDLNAIEKASCFDRYLREYDCTQDELARRVHINRSTVANFVRLLELPDEVKGMVVSGALTQGHARAILGLPEGDRVGYARRAVDEGLSVRRVEQLVQDAAAEAGLRVVGGDGVSRKAGASGGEQIAALERELSDALGAKVGLTQNAKGAGKITVRFTSLDDFERLRAQLTTSSQRSTYAA